MGPGPGSPQKPVRPTLRWGPGRTSLRPLPGLTIRGPAKPGSRSGGADRSAGPDRTEIAERAGVKLDAERLRLMADLARLDGDNAR